MTAICVAQVVRQAQAQCALSKVKITTVPGTPDEKCNRGPMATERTRKLPWPRRCPGSPLEEAGSIKPMHTPSSAKMSLTRPPDPRSLLPGLHRHPTGLGMLLHVGKHLLQAP